MLVPAGILILILLAAISADSAIAYMGQRQLQNEVAAAVNNAATEAVSPDALQMGQAARPDAARAERIANATVMHDYSGGLTATNVQTTVEGNTVTVTAEGQVRYIFRGRFPRSPQVRHHKSAISSSTSVRPRCLKLSPRRPPGRRGVR